MVKIYIVRHAESSNNARPDGEPRSSDPLLTNRGKRQSEELAQYVINQRMKHPHCPNENSHKDDTRGANIPLAGSSLPWKFDRLYVSPMTRTLMTAAPLVAGLSVTANDACPPPDIHVIPTIFENGGCFLGDRSDDSKASVLPSDIKHGLNRDEIVKLLRSELPTKEDAGKDDGGDDIISPPSIIQPKIMIDPRCTEDRGWWKGGKETDREYLSRCFNVVDWMWEQDKDCMLITHGIFNDTLTRILLNLDNVKSLRKKIDDSSDTTFGDDGILMDLNFDSFFLTGNVCISCFDLDTENKKLGVLFINHPVVSPESRSGHKLGGFCLREDAW